MTPLAPVSVLGAATLLAAWLGAALLATAVVAPAAFAVLPSRALAGAVVGRVLAPLFWSGAAVGLVVLLAARALPARGWSLGAAALLVAACLAAQLLVAPRIERVHAAIGGPVDALDSADPRRQRFARLHGVSVGCLAAAELAAGAALVLLLRFPIPSRPHS